MRWMLRFCIKRIDASVPLTANQICSCLLLSCHGFLAAYGPGHPLLPFGQFTVAAAAYAKNMPPAYFLNAAGATAEVRVDTRHRSDARRVSDSVAERISFIGSSIAGVLGAFPNEFLVTFCSHKKLLAAEGETPFPRAVARNIPLKIAPLPRSGKDGGKMKVRGISDELRNSKSHVFHMKHMVKNRPHLKRNAACKGL